MTTWAFPFVLWRTYRNEDISPDGSFLRSAGFLAKNGGLNSGLMIMQYTAASLCSECKVLGPSIQCGHDPHVGGTRRPCEHGHDCRAQGAGYRVERGDRARHRVRGGLPGLGV